MVEEVSVKGWDTMGLNQTSLFIVQLLNKSDIYEIAESLNLPYIFKKGEELVCSDNTLLYWYKP